MSRNRHQAFEDIFHEHLWSRSPAPPRNAVRMLPLSSVLPSSLAAVERNNNMSFLWLCLKKSGELSFLVSQPGTEETSELSIRHDQKGAPVVTFLSSIPIAKHAKDLAACARLFAVPAGEAAVKNLQNTMKAAVTSSGRNDGVNDMVKKALIAIIDADNRRQITSHRSTLLTLLNLKGTSEAAVDELCRNLQQFSEEASSAGEEDLFYRFCNAYGKWSDVRLLGIDSLGAAAQAYPQTSSPNSERSHHKKSLKHLARFEDDSAGPTMPWARDRGV
ncbi:hypothetical protein NM688_g3341 [Phlebia brevispora]|uniref:Uncharacterized protein n=1 Tax=Phlebia brevispora TaxID=194682 RepID=A0ACC1T642_9APHY|nr:hypothetical protein NM688_g3341 [Phlebia brevispora]